MCARVLADVFYVTHSSHEKEVTFSVYSLCDETRLMNEKKNPKKREELSKKQQKKKETQKKESERPQQSF